MFVLKPFTASNAALTLCFVYGPLIVSSAWVAISAIVKPIWLKLPIPPDTAEPYCLRIALYSPTVGVVLPSTGSSSALT